MTIVEMKEMLDRGALEKYTCLYADLPAQKARFTAALDAFAKLYGEDRDITVYSVSGRTEICGNHTDHNFGKVLAGAIDRDILAIASPNEDGVVRFCSEGYPAAEVDLSLIDDPANFEDGTSAALVAGLAAGFVKEGYSIGGYDAYMTSDVAKGSGISSSAAFEVMIGNILNHLYNDGNVSNVEIAKLSQYAENVFFGKPCGLMDQMACAVGGFVFIDFEKPGEPVIEPIEFSLTEAGYVLCIVNTGGNHADLTPDYAAVPAEMKAVAAALGHTVLRETSYAEVVANIAALRASVGDRAILRALHFFRENERVDAVKAALLARDTDTFLATVSASGSSSHRYLQNVYSNQNPAEQGLTLALCLTEDFLADKPGACRVHGGGFAGTIQVFLPAEYAAQYSEKMNAVFGEGAATVLRIRPLGASKIFG